MFRKTFISAILLFLFTTPVYAAAPTVESLELSINLVWVMLGAFLVFFMHAGFAMVESGFTRSKNTLNILMKNFLTICIASILFFLQPDMELCLVPQQAQLLEQMVSS